MFNNLKSVKMKSLFFTLILILPNAIVFSQNIVYSTFLGGAKEDIVDNIILDNGYLYISGTTMSGNFPVTSNSYDNTFNGGVAMGWGTEDIYLLKYNLNTNEVEYCTYLGGSQGPDFAWSMEVDNDGNVYLGGNTGASDYPVTNNVYDNTYSNVDFRHADGILTKINSTGESIVFSTFFPLIYDFKLDDEGNIYIASIVKEESEIKGASIDSTFNGGEDIYLAKLSPDGTELLYSTYIGGTGDDRVNTQIYLDDSLNLYFSGSTTSANLPVTNGSTYSDTSNLLGDGYVGKFSFKKNKLEFLSYLGGSSDDEITNLLVKGDTIFTLGRTVSTDLPVTTQAYDNTFNGGKFDFFLSSHSVVDGSLIACTYLGGSEYENHRSLDIDNVGNLIITGNTNSTDFPTTNDAYNQSYNGGSSATYWMGDAVFVKMSAELDNIIYSSFIGGSNDEYGVFSSQTSSGNFVIVGSTKSGDFPVSDDAIDNSINGDRDVFIMNFNIDNANGINRSEYQPNLKLYPNPVRNYLNIELEQQIDDTKYSIVDMHGKTCKNGIIKEAIDVSLLSKGTYLLLCESDDLKTSVLFNKE